MKLFLLKLLSRQFASPTIRALCVSLGKDSGDWFFAGVHSHGWDAIAHRSRRVYLNNRGNQIVVTNGQGEQTIKLNTFEQFYLAAAVKHWTKTDPHYSIWRYKSAVTML